jgi:hypothetical protein
MQAAEPLVRLETEQGGKILKHAFDSFKDLLTVVLITFSAKGVRIDGQSGNTCIDVCLFIDAEKIKETCGIYTYNSDKPFITVYANVLDLTSCLKRWTTHKILVMVFPSEDSDILCIGCHDKQKHAQWDVKLMVDQGERISLDFFLSLEVRGAEHQASVSICSEKFHEYLGDATPASDTRVVTLGLTAQKEFKIYGHTTLIAAQNVLDPVVDGGTTGGAYTNVLPGCALPLQEQFFKTTIDNIPKAYKVCKILTIYMQRDFPFSFLYDTAIGPLRYYLTPNNRDDDEEEDEAQANKAAHTTLYRSILAEQMVEKKDPDKEKEVKHKHKRGKKKRDVADEAPAAADDQPEDKAEEEPVEKKRKKYKTKEHHHSETNMEE